MKKKLVYKESFAISRLYCTVSKYGHTKEPPCFLSRSLGPGLEVSYVIYDHITKCHVAVANALQRVFGSVEWERKLVMFVSLFANSVSAATQ